MICIIDEHYLIEFLPIIVINDGILNEICVNDEHSLKM